MPLVVSIESRPTIFFCLVLAVMAISVAGCGKSVGAVVSGVVTIDGRPAPAGIRIDFEPQVEHASSSTGYTDGEGRYTMMFNANLQGVMPGESLVRVSVEKTVDIRTGKPETPQGLKGMLVSESPGQGTIFRKTVRPGKNIIDISIDAGSKGRE